MCVILYKFFFNAKSESRKSKLLLLLATSGKFHQYSVQDAAILEIEQLNRSVQTELNLDILTAGVDLDDFADLKLSVVSEGC